MPKKDRSGAEYPIAGHNPPDAPGATSSTGDPRQKRRSRSPPCSIPPPSMTGRRPSAQRDRPILGSWWVFCRLYPDKVSPTTPRSAGLRDLRFVHDNRDPALARKPVAGVHHVVDRGEEALGALPPAEVVEVVPPGGV